MSDACEIITRAKRTLHFHFAVFEFAHVHDAYGPRNARIGTGISSLNLCTVRDRSHSAVTGGTGGVSRRRVASRRVASRRIARSRVAGWGRSGAARERGGGGGLRGAKNTATVKMQRFLC